ncbi:Putative nucleoside transporter YegT [Planctomycetes bacterium Pan216]|uniref:Nucleoside transporter YegT n=1 Tax=Kolteria novifilia TaxID=2527975 RepID=A0A518BCW6_9BACT|nr:Putative nucleoside transporter YegT [Planctomycetes bacterium Pan216]
MHLSVRALLSGMMFLQYLVWGLWFVVLGEFLAKGLSFDGSKIGLCYMAIPLAAMVSPFFVGLVADRFFATQWVLAVLHIVGGIILYFASTQESFGAMFPMLFIYALCYMPTLALTNSLSFRQMTDPSRQFPGIRVWGTIGWIVAGIFIGQLRYSDTSWFLQVWGPAIDSITGVEATRIPMMIASVTGIVMGVFCLFLPHTPPNKSDGPPSIRDILGLDALALMKERSFAVFVIASFLVCIPLQFYYAFTNIFLNELNMESPASKMTMGQMSEIFFMLLMPFFFARLGVKWMLIVGMGAWVIRYALFSAAQATMISSGVDAVGEYPLLDFGPPMMLYIGIILHGICYDFFFVTGQIYVDHKAPEKLRGAAQGFIAFVTLGAGAAAGALISGYVFEWFADENLASGAHWNRFWLVPAIGAAIVLIAFGFLFKEKGTISMDEVEQGAESAEGQTPQAG